MSGGEYVPTTEDLREAYVQWLQRNSSSGIGRPWIKSEKEGCDLFDTLLARIASEAAEKALREAAEFLDSRPNGSWAKGPVTDEFSGDLGYYGEADWLRALADRLKAEREAKGGAE